MFGQQEFLRWTTRGIKACPYVQRVVAFLIHANVAFTYKNVDLKNKPDWFLEKSPLGKVPVLRFPDGRFIFESAIINEFIDDLLPQDKRLSPSDPFTRSHNRAWLEFVGSIFTDFFGSLGKTTKEDFEAALAPIHKKLQLLEKELKGPYFNGEKIALIDIAIAPLFIRLYLADITFGLDLGEKQKLPKVLAYFNTLRNIPAISTAAAFQKQPDVAGFESHKDIKALHDKPSDAAVWQTILPQYRQVLQSRFASSYAVTLIKA
eukprot:Phypoly_transcript_15423.p1 GENE.Phypoly_transcript_15423~~Phypoly_transcript_15423.p1  ORF type:complete len:262 (+),score=51.32 Phypoly_transcript_15423:63-848(+)